MANEHTDKRYEEELKKLREEILYMGGLVEDQIQKAVKVIGRPRFPTRGNHHRARP